MGRWGLGWELSGRGAVEAGELGVWVMGNSCRWKLGLVVRLRDIYDV